MVKGLAEAVGVVAVVGSEDVGEGVAFGLEHEAAASVIGEDLIDGGGAGVGRDDEHPEGRLFRWLQVRVLFLGAVEAGLLDAVFIHFFAVEFPKPVMDGLCQAAAEGEPTFAGGCGRGDVEEEVGIDLLVVVNAVHLAETGGPGGEGAEDEDVGILVRAGVTGHFVKESREVTVEAVGEGGHRSRGGGFHHSVSSISSIR